MRRALLVSGIVALLLVAARLRIQASTPQPQCPEGSDLIGAWQSLEVTQAPTGGDTYDGRTAVLGKAGPGIRVFSKRHYAYLQVSNPAEPRPDLPTPPPTAEQLLAIWGPIAANGGLYDVSCDTLNTRPYIAKNPRAMRPGFRIPFLFKIVGDSLWLDGPPAVGTVKYLRLDR